MNTRALKLSLQNTLAVMALGLITTSASAFVTQHNFFEDTLIGQLGEKVSDIKVKAIEEVSGDFQIEVDKRTVEESKPQFFEVSFNQLGDKLICQGALIKESKRLSVSRFPEGFRDRSALVLIGDCFQDDESTDLLVEYYQVYPLNETLPLDNQESIAAYRLYQKLIKARPQTLCTDNDTNSEGIPRHQLAIHNIGDRVSFYTGISRSSPPIRNGMDIIWVEDRALYIEEVDQGSLPEVRATLDFVSHTLKGTLLFSFEKKDCVEAVDSGLHVLSCYTDINPERAPTFQPVEEYSDVPLTLRRVRATFQSHLTKRLLLGANNSSTIITDKDYDLIYQFEFDSPRGRRFMKATKKFRDSEIESSQECRYDPKAADSFPMK